MQQQQTMPWSRWRDWRYAFIFGLPLGALELGLIYITITHNYWLSPQQATLIGWLLCLLIPGIAGYHICYRRRHTDAANGRAGFRMGVVGWTVVMAGFAVWLGVGLAVYYNTPLPPASESRTFDSPTFAQSFALFVAIVFLALLAMISFVGLSFSAASGRIGEALATWRVKRLEARGQRM